MDILNNRVNKEAIKEIKEITITIQLNFNPYDKDDNRLIKQMQDLNDKLEHLGNPYTITDIENGLKGILSEAHYYVYYEWSGLKKEAEKGILTKCDKKNLKKIWDNRKEKLEDSENPGFKI